jgi:hypothetical protein
MTKLLREKGFSSIHPVLSEVKADSLEYTITTFEDYRDFPPAPISAHFTCILDVLTWTAGLNESFLADVVHYIGPIHSRFLMTEPKNIVLAHIPSSVGQLDCT